MNFHENLRAIRERMNISREDMAKSLSITVNAYGMYETGKREPDIEKLKVIAAALHVSIDELLCYEGEATDWIEAKLKPALEKTPFSFDGLDEHGKLKFSYYDFLDSTDRGKLEEELPPSITLPPEEARAIYDRAERNAAPDFQKSISALLEKALFEKFLFWFLD